nr:hypothetical protein [Pseudomonadota bacterium]
MSAVAKAKVGMKRRRSTPRGDTPFDRLIREKGKANELTRLTGLRGAANRVAASHLIRDHGDRPVLYITAHSRAADDAALALRGMLGEREDTSRIRAFPRHDTLPFDRFSPQPFLVSQRMEVLHLLDQALDGREQASPIVIAPMAALALRVPARELLRKSTERISVGASLDRDLLAARLVGRGYQRMALVEEPGEIAIRGDIVDIYPPQLANPVRIELWGDEVDSIRSFDPASQRSQTKSATVLLPPPRELLFDRDDIVDREPAIRENAAEQGVSMADVDRLIDSLLRGHLPPGAESLAPLIQPDQESFFAYLSEQVLVLLEEPEEAVAHLDEVFGEIESNQHAARGERLTVPIESLLLSTDEVSNGLADLDPIRLERLDIELAVDEPGRHVIETQTQDELRRDLVSSRSPEPALTPLARRCHAGLAVRWRLVTACGTL